MTAFVQQLDLGGSGPTVAIKDTIDIAGVRTRAGSRALEGVALGLMDDHLAHCVLDAARAGEDEGAAKLKEASDAIRRLVRS